MSDAVAALKKRIADYNEAKDNLSSMINSLEIAVKVIENDAPIPSLANLHESAKRNPPPTTKREAHVRKVHKPKAEKAKPAVKTSGLRPYTQEDVVAVALTLIRAHGPTGTPAIGAEVLKKFGRSTTSVSTCLRQEANKRRTTPRLMLNDGLWKITPAAKQGTVAHSPAEADRLLAQARANRDNPATSDIRV